MTTCKCKWSGCKCENSCWLRFLFQCDEEERGFTAFVWVRARAVFCHIRGDGYCLDLNVKNNSTWFFKLTSGKACCFKISTNSCVDMTMTVVGLIWYHSWLVLKSGILPETVFKGLCNHHSMTHWFIRYFSEVCCSGILTFDLLFFFGQAGSVDL